MTSTTIDFETIKKGQRAGWETGDYPRVGNTLQIIAELLVEAADIRAGQHVLDVACGQGNAALAAARRFADATGVDYATNLLAQGRERAAAEHLDGDLHRGRRRGPATCRTASSTRRSAPSGVMFAPDHQRAADELVRVTRGRWHHRAGQLDADRDGRRALPHGRSVGATPRRRQARHAVGHAATT